MRPIMRTLLRAGGLLLSTTCLILGMGGSAAATTRPPAAVRPTTCNLVAGTRTCALFAKTGTLTLPGPTTVTIWGYADTAGGAATLPGPLLVVNQGEALDIVLTNVNLPDATALSIPQLGGAPDTTGVTAGTSTTYHFAAADLQPGTYLYEAGLTANGPRQVAMGLVGALIVRPPAAGQAYAIPASAYDDEALLVLSELDPAFNAAPTTFDLRSYAPKYWLINGKAFPDIDTPAPLISTGGGRRVLLRYVNAGLLHHSMSLLGLRQIVLANDARLYPSSYQAVAETIPAGATMDAIVNVPAAAPAGAKYALFEAGQHLDNNGARTSSAATAPIKFGGMLTFLTVSGSAPPAGPVTNNVVVAPSPTNGTVAVTLSASIGVAGDPPITAAEYFVDTPGASGSGCALSLGAGGPPTSASGTISPSGGAAPCPDLAGLSSGTHLVYVHGQNANGWGGFGAATLNLDKSGPTTNLLGLNPNPTNGTVNVALSATGSDSATGGNNVDAAEYFVGPAAACPVSGGGGGAAMTLSSPASPAVQVQFSATLAAASVAALAEGPHTIGVHSRDALGNWGPCATITLNVDKTAPATSGVTATPNPTNGAIGVLIGDFLQEKLTATAADPLAGGINSNIKAMEGFIDTGGPNGSGIVFLATDAAYNSPTESAFAGIPLFDMNQLSQGRHTVYVHTQDAAGNWNTSYGATFLDVDRTGPTVTASAAPNPTAGAASVTLSASATDPPTGGTPAPAPAAAVVAAEWFDGADPGGGNGTPLSGTFGGTSVSGLSATITTAGLSFGTHNIGVRAKDAAGNWGPVTTVLLNVTPSDGIFADGFESGNFTAWNGGASGSGLSVTAAGAMVGVRAMQAVISGAPNDVQDNTPAAETTYRARFYFNPFGTSSGAGQQHDILVALNSTNQTVFRVQYRTSGGQSQVRAVVSRSGGTSATSWFALTNNAANVIEVSWQSGSSAPFRLYTAGVLRQTLTVNTSSTALRVETVRLGPQVGPAPPAGQGTTPAGTSLAGVSGTEYFDAFVSRRNSNAVIGP